MKVDDYPQDELDDIEELPTEATAEPPRGRWRLLKLLALLLIAGAIAGGYYLYLLEVAPLRALPARVDELATQLSAPRDGDTAQLATRLDALQATLERLQNDQQDNRARLLGFEDHLALLGTRANWSQREWMLAEIHYLVQLADDRLRFMRDKGTASAALQSAINRLDRLADPALDPLRERLRIDRQQIASYAPPDVLALLTPLETLTAQLRPMPRPVPDATPTEQPAAAPASLLETVKQALARRIRVVQQDRPLNALERNTVPGHQLELLRLRMAALRLALLQEHLHGFRQELDAIDAWAAANLDAGQAAPIQAELASLRAADPFPAPPSLQESVAAVRNLLSEAGGETPAEPAGDDTPAAGGDPS